MDILCVVLFFFLLFSVNKYLNIYIKREIRNYDIVIRIVKELEMDKKFLKFYLKNTPKFECVFLLTSVFDSFLYNV